VALVEAPGDIRLEGVDAAVEKTMTWLRAFPDGQIKVENEVANADWVAQRLIFEAISDTVAVMRSGRIVEQGRAGELYARPKSDYTKALLAAVPVPDPERMLHRKAERRRLRAAVAQG